MRILALTNLFPNPLQPQRAPFSRQLLAALAKRHAVRVIAPIAWTDEIAARWRRAAKLPENRQVTLDGITVDHPRYLFLPKMSRGWYGHFFGWSIQNRFQCALNEFQPNVIYASWAYPDGWAAVEFGHRVGLPVLLRVHGSDINLLGQYPSRRRGTCQALCRADAVIAPSHDLAERIFELGVSRDRIHVIYNGVDASIFHPGSRAEARKHLGLPSDSPIILFVGNLVAIKGIDVLIGACAMLATRKINFTCYVIGQGPLRRQIERQIQDCKLQDRMKLLGTRTHDELADWYRAGNLLVLPSCSEGLPNVLLEAAACGVRYVASRVGGIPEITDAHCGRLVAPGDSNALADAIGEELSEPTTDWVKPISSPRSFDNAAIEIESVLRRLLKQPANADEMNGSSDMISSLDAQ